MTHKIVKIFAISLALVFIAVALTASMPQSSAQVNPQVLAQAVASPVSTGQPIVSENTNITWSAFNQSMAPNEYLNSTGHPEYINAEPSLYYHNYISVNPENILAPKALQNDALGDLNTSWDSSMTAWTIGNSATNSTVSGEWTNVSGMGEIKTVDDVTGSHGSVGAAMDYYIDSPNFPSQNLQYDYITAIFSVSAPTDSGAVGLIQLWNGTNHGLPITPQITSGTYYISENLAQIQQKYNYSTTFNTTAGKGYSSRLEINLQLNVPSGAPDGTYGITIHGLAFTTYPITFGSNATGSVVNENAGNLQLSDFHPDNVKNVSIVNDGYSEALSMPTQMSSNYTQTQNQITGSSYIEETTTQGNLVYPTGTDISYSGTNVTMQMNGIEGKQVPLLNVNGVSFSNEVSNVSGNATMNLGSTNPNQPVNVIYQVEYTATQWNSFTAPPFFLSVQGIEYYWWIGLIAIFGGLGIFAGLRSYATGKEENLRAPPKVR